MRQPTPTRRSIVLAVVTAAVLFSGACAETDEPPGTTPASPSSDMAASAGATATSSPRPSITTPADSSIASQSPASPSFAPGADLTLEELLDLLATAPEQRAGYDRSLFRHWVDADGDGCNTRREVLITEAVVPPLVGGGCSLSGGSWVSLYDGLAFIDPAGMDIDHVVALGEAWDSGAYAWNDDRRERFANDLDVAWALIAVSAASNRSKSDKDPADWVPPDSADLCPFLSAWIAVKVRWQLAIDEREQSALASLVIACPDGRMPVVVAL